MEFHEAVAELDTLVQTLEREGDERALMLLELIDAIHRPAIELILNGELDHPVAHAVLSMYGFTDVDDRVEVEEALDGGDGETVVTVQRVRGQSSHTGLELDLRWAAVWTVRAGKVVRIQGYAGKRTALQAAGLRR